MQNFKAKASSAIIWSFVGQYSSQALTFVLSLVLARLLGPEEFGLIAMATIFTSIAQIFQDFGLSSSIIQKKEVSQDELSSAFFFNAFCGLVTTVIFAVLAYPIAAFYNEPRLINIIQAISLSFIVSSLSIVQSTLLKKSLQFRKQVTLSLIATVVSGCVAIILAYYDYGVWSLVMQSMLNGFIITVLLWFVSSWRPSLMFSYDSLKGHFAFGLNLFASNLIDRVIHNFDSLLIGKFFSASTLGFFNRAKTLRDFPVRNLSAALIKALFPILATIQDDNIALKNVYRKLMLIIIFITCPILLILIVIAEPLIIVLLGEKWLSTVPFFQILCLSGFLFPINAINVNVLVAKGLGSKFLRLEIIKKSLYVIGIGSGVFWGIYGVIVATVIVEYIATYINMSYSGKAISYSTKEQILDILPTLILSVIVASIAKYTLILTENISVYFSLILSLLSAVLAYLAMAYFISIEAFTLIISNFEQKLKLKINK